MLRILVYAAEVFLAVAFLTEVVWPVLRRRKPFPTIRKFIHNRKETK